MAIRPTTKHNIQIDEENINTPNFAVVTNIYVTGSAGMIYTGVDQGTGQVTIYVSGTVVPPTPPPAIDQIGIMGQNKGVPLGTGTIFNINGTRLVGSISGTVLNLTNSPDPIELIGIYGLSGTTSLGTGTSLSVGGYLVASITGTFLYLAASVGTDINRLATGDRGVTNGDSHTHTGTNGGFISYPTLLSKPTVSGHTLNTDVTPLGYVLLPGNGLNTGIASGTTNYTPPYLYGLNANRNNTGLVRAGTLKNLNFRTTTTQPASGSMVVTVEVNSIATALTTTVAAGAASNLFQDTTHSVSVVAGDLVTISIKNNASSTSASITASSLELEYSTT